MAAARVAAAAAACLLFLAGARADDKPRRLRIVNGCEDGPIWIAHMAGAGLGPDPQNVMIPVNDSHDFLTTDGLAATRYWAKMGCDAEGNNCTVGESGGPGQGCVVHTAAGWDDYSRCAPPVDTKFEASFGINGQPCNPKTPGGTEMKGCDYIDISLVDGFTLPVKLEMIGDCQDSRNGAHVELINCTDLTMQECPKEENLTATGHNWSLRAVNPATKNASGCYSPCQRLLDTKWVKEPQRMAENPEVAPYCCPTPPVNPEECRTGPIITTQYLDVVHSKCKGAYSYAYDDSNGLLRCSSSTHYVLTFYCPGNSTSAKHVPPVADNGTAGAPAFLAWP